ncbi:hypothetical protein [Maritalea porphyrae]|jgi:hypothetical protein|uniref:hypothetical protein n=1 Tax=Maritalea porphyrae TaxID=880732 RepID=UPI0022B00304|nr:hypothetical protein [Maritalea porphyrae]MCZ4272711.1 hypothetical protein [Maritalea porphyrae]
MIVRRAPKNADLRSIAFLLWIAVLSLCGFVTDASAQIKEPAERVELIAQGQTGFGRLIIRFKDRLNLPSYTLKTAGGVLALEFSKPIEINLPDVTEHLSEYIAVGRLDPDRKGIRFGLKQEYRINKIEAGERLFIDLIPSGWTGLDPALPEEVVKELALRAEQAALLAERRRKAKIARESKPELDVRLGRHPTFSRLVFDWTMETEATYDADDRTVTLLFEWPVDVDFYTIESDLPPEILGMSKLVSDDGLLLTFQLAEEVEPRFFNEEKRRYTLDLDFSNNESISVPLADLVEGNIPEDLELTVEEQEKTPAEIMQEAKLERGPSFSRQTAITPFINRIGGTVRLVFPFEQDTPAAVYKRGGAVWMVFDTHVNIGEPSDMDMMGGIASDFEVDSAGETQIVRLNMNAERLATLGSEGRSWVLSLGDILISPTEPMVLTQDTTATGRVRVAADLLRPAKVHKIRDPNVGDMLHVVTAYPPSRAVVRDLEYVDFRALRAVHGLVIKPFHDELNVTIEESRVLIDAADGLVLSAGVERRTEEKLQNNEDRVSFLDLTSFGVGNPQQYREKHEEISNRITEAEGPALEATRLELVRFYLSMDLAHEAIGVADVVLSDTKRPALLDKTKVAMAAANVLAHRPDDALELLLDDEISENTDAVMWRTLARVQRSEYDMARIDALRAEEVVQNYPSWLQNKFYFAAARAAVEEEDASLAVRYLDAIDFALLDKTGLSHYDLLSGRVDEIEERYEEALDTYGSVMNADIRPTHAEAVYRTLVILEKTGKIDVEKATQTLELQSLIWRGGDLAAKIQHMMGRFQFQSGDYRSGFETLELMAAEYQDTDDETALYDEAKQVFANLYLNGEADRLDPIAALAIFYDFRHLAPVGAKGDEMIRNLARRLVRVDLLEQAAGLLEYQIDNRLEGVARAKIAADLAVIHIANHRPDLALKTLYRTRLANLVPTLERQRRILEARALIDAGRDELAVDILRGLEGRDAALLEVDAHWAGRRYREAGEMLERVYADGLPDGVLSTAVRNHMVKAAVAYTLASDEIGLTRLRAKYSGRMSGTPEWPVFEFVTSKTAYGTVEFRKLARQIADVDSLNSFLNAYKTQYVDEGAIAPQADVL